MLYIGKHCCLWCNISSDEMAQPLKDRGRSQLRTLEGLQADYHRFQAAGGHLKKAKLFHNVIAPHFFDVPISQVSICEQKGHSINIYIIHSMHASCHILYRWQYHAYTSALAFSISCSSCMSCTAVTIWTFCWLWNRLSWDLAFMTVAALASLWQRCNMPNN